MKFPYLVVTLVSTLVVHCIYWIMFNKSAENDELRYLDQAARYLSGEEFYKNGRIVNPPLLPLLFVYLQRLGVPVAYLPLFSIIAVAAATSILFHMLSKTCLPFWACILSLFFALHPAVLMLGSDLMSEPYTLFLATVSALIVIRLYSSNNLLIVNLPMLALTFACLAMLKPLFGYTITVALFISLFVAVFLQGNIRRFVFSMSIACLLALVLCVPFLHFTYGETGNLFSWGTGAGDHLYWMSIGGENVWGSWVPDIMVDQIPFLVENDYAREINSTLHMRYTDRDEHLKLLAMERIIENPQHFVRNIMANAGRVLFNYPYSFRLQSLFTYGYMLPNMILYLSFSISVLLLPITWRFQDVSRSWLLLFFLIFLGGNILVGSTARQALVMMVPILLWLSYQVSILIKIGVLNPLGNDKNVYSN